VVIGLPATLNNVNIVNDDSASFFVSGKQKKDLYKHQDYNIIKRLLDEGRIFFIESASRVEQIHELLDILYINGSMIAVLEGGATVAGSFFDANEIDQCMYFFSPILIGKGKNLIEGKGRHFITDSLKLYDVTHISLGQDILVSAYREPYQFEAM